MSDGVIVALITVAGSVVVAVITAVLSQRKPHSPTAIHVTLPDRSIEPAKGGTPTEVLASNASNPTAGITPSLPGSTSQAARSDVLPSSQSPSIAQKSLFSMRIKASRKTQDGYNDGPIVWGSYEIPQRFDLVVSAAGIKCLATDSGVESFEFEGQLLQDNTVKITQSSHPFPCDYDRVVVLTADDEYRFYFTTPKQANAFTTSLRQLAELEVVRD